MLYILIAHHHSASETREKSVTKLRLTEIVVQRLPEGLYFDERTPNFGLRIGKNRKTWIVVKGEKRTQIRIGHYPSLSLSEARNRALVALGSPMQEKVHLSFSDALESFLGLPRWRPQSKKVLTSSLRHFNWSRSLDKITHEDVAAALDAIKGSSARAHALKDIRTFFNWCVPRYLSRSPCEGLKMAPQPSRDRILTEDEIKAVSKACEGTFGTIVKLLLLTGQRKMEIGSLTWNNVTDTTITIPADIAKNGREHVIPIGPFTRSLLPKKSNGYLFRSAKDNDELYNGYTFHLKQLHKASGISGWTLHDLRRSYASQHAAIGTPLHIIERLLNHKSGQISGVAAIYNRHSYQKEMQEAVENYEKHIQALIARA